MPSAFNQLVDDIAALRRKRASTSRPIKKPQDRDALQKALKATAAALTGKNQHPRQGTAADLREKLRDLMQQASHAFSAGQITGTELSMFETMVNNHLNTIRNGGQA